MKALLCSFFFMVFFLGCGKEEKEVKNTITSANSFLTQGDCQGAIDTITSIPYQAQNYLYVKTYASAYACRAGFSVVAFFTDDIPKVGSPSILGGMSRFANATRMTEARSESYEDLQVAINSLLYIGGIDTTRNPTPERRRLNFSDQTVKDVHTFLLYLLLEQLGKYARFYGNGDSNGVKGQGTLTTNQCFLTYANFAFNAGGDLATYLNSGVTGSCTGVGIAGHPSLMNAAAIRVERACQGIVLMNNFRVVLLEIIDELTGEFDDFDDIEVAFNTFDTLAADAIGGDATQLTTTLSQSVCEDTFGSNPNALQTYFAGIFETLM